MGKRIYQAMGIYRATILFLALLLVAGCAELNSGQQTRQAATDLTETPDSSAPGDLIDGADFITVATDAPSRFRVFEDIDQYGNVVGFDADVMANLAVASGLEYEFVVTGYSGLLSSVSKGEFNAAMSAMVIPDEPTEGITYTLPYLEVGQVLVVRANERRLRSYEDVVPATRIAVQGFTHGEQAALEVLGVDPTGLVVTESIADALQAVIDREAQGAVIDSDDAEHFTRVYAEQLMTTDGGGREAWISSRAYGIAVASSSVTLLERLNSAIEEITAEGTIDRLVRAWLISKDEIAAGQSLVGTPANVIVIGVVGEPPDLDPAAQTPDLISWDIKRNTMSGLLMYNERNELVPIIAREMPEVSEDGLHYTFALRSGLIFSDNSELTAEDVKFSIDRSAANGNYLINDYLKDDDDDGFADSDAVEVVDDYTVRLNLRQAVSYFDSLLASPPYFVVSDDCFSASVELESICGGIGVYNIVEWEDGVSLRLKANPHWPGQAPSFENITIQFMEGSDELQQSLESGAIDIAWHGLSDENYITLRQDTEFRIWEGPSAFKSYLVFEQDTAPWGKAKLRQAVAHSVDRSALASDVFRGLRDPLYSPIPDGVPGQIDALPMRDIDHAKSLLVSEGYDQDNPLEMTIWYVDDGRYTELEEEYAQVLAEQLEESGMIEVTLHGAGWSTFRPASTRCDYPTFLLGWPSTGQPAAYLDAMSWMEYFIVDTRFVCSNYDSDDMNDLVEAAMAESNLEARLELYQQIQELWASDFPTLELTQTPLRAVSQEDVLKITIDAMGMMHYDLLTKSG